MIFTPDMLIKVLDGTKTQTRRPVKSNDIDYTNALPCSVWVDLPNGSSRSKWRVHRRYAIAPGRGKKGVGHIRLLDIRKERAIDISDADARAEGFDSREAFFDKLRSLYGKDVDLTAPYWALTFELVKP